MKWAERRVRASRSLHSPKRGRETVAIWIYLSLAAGVENKKKVSQNSKKVLYYIDSSGWCWVEEGWRARWRHAHRSTTCTAWLLYHSALHCREYLLCRQDHGGRFTRVTPTSGLCTGKWRAWVLSTWASQIYVAAEDSRERNSHCFVKVSCKYRLLVAGTTGADKGTLWSQSLAFSNKLSS